MPNQEKYKILNKVKYPADIRELDVNDLKTLCGDIREYMIDVISQVGGHFGGGLGTVELTVALHKVFNTPHDALVWDTGHQAYPHKILTGRKDLLPTIRQLNGISGFLKRSESEYDVFGAGHASTSISAALGVATGAKKMGVEKKVVAIIGDGAMTGGMAYEALNNSGVLQSDIVVVLNDNNMSISPNVWQISNYFTEMISHPEYNRFKGYVWDLTGKLDTFGDRLRKIAGRLDRGLKSIIVTPGMLFEALGFRYFGPINAHNISNLVKLFEQVKELKGPILIHAISSKGKGYKPAENHVQRLHAATPFDKETGKAHKTSNNNVSYTSVFGKALVELVKEQKNIVGITGAMADGTGLSYLQEAFPNNYIDVGIAEEHAVTFAAGMATQGIIPVVAVYSTFLQRAFDQIVHDVALQKLHVVFILDRAGLVGADGPTHHGTLDLTYLRMIPNMVIMSPKDESELRNMLSTAINYKKGPIAIRYPRGYAVGVEMQSGFTDINIGEGEVLRQGNDIAILSVGLMTQYAIQVAETLQKDGQNAEIINMRFIKPLDEKLLHEVCKKFNKIVTLEENTLIGGFSGAVAEFMADNKYKNDLLRIGIADEFIDHGTQEELHKIIKIDAEGITEKIKNFWQ